MNIMWLEPYEIHKSNEVRNFIKETLSHEELIELKCTKCFGTGLSGVFKHGEISDSSWSGEYCDACNGVGYLISINFINNGVIFFCQECNGTGFSPISYNNNFKCKKCNGNGKLNWLENVFGVSK